MERFQRENRVGCVRICIALVGILVMLATSVVSVEAKWVKTSGKYRYTTNAKGTQYYKNRWAKINGKYYYFDKKGYRKSGWLSYNKNKYYLNKKGVRVTGFQTIKKKRYYFSSKGVLITGWIKSNGYYYYADANGVIQTGLKQIGQQVYYFDSNGKRATDTNVTLGNMVYYFALNGTLQYNGSKEDNLIRYINVARMLKGYLPLTYSVNGNLVGAALLRASELEEKTSHIRPNGKEYATVLQTEFPVDAYWSGECILWGKEKGGIDVAKSWLSDRNANILMKKEANEIGIAKYKAKDGCEYWTAIVVQRK